MERISHQTKDIEIRGEIQNVWDAFFSSFPRLLPIQREVIPRVLRGRNLIVVSPAATGKTEAICAPLLQRLITERWSGLSVLYITPTRALVNDLYRRLKGPLDSLGVTLARKTGDRAEFNPKNPSSFLITTPESFDSLLSRHPSSLRNLRCICLDELHLYDGTYRGDALRVLLERVRRLRKDGKISFYGLSATISNPYKVGKRYFDDFDIMVMKAPREIRYNLLRFSKDVRFLLNEFRTKGLSKILIFCNTRQEAENLALQIKRDWSYEEKVFVHHASLTKQVREEVEEVMNEADVAIVVSTITLELGIDIGDIDCIVFKSPPPTCFSLMQRLGRGNRRGGVVLAYGLYENEFERVVFRVMFELVRRGWIEEDEYCSRLSVACQQVFSYVYQKRRKGTTLRALARVLKPLELSGGEVRGLVNHLIEQGYLRSEAFDLLYIGERLEGLVERGLIHSNIESRREEYEVVDVESGNLIGKIESISPSFALRGRLWSVHQIKGSKVYAIERKGIVQERKVFHGKGRGLWDWRLGMKLKFAFFKIKEEEILPYIEKESTIYLFHFLGFVYGFVWAEALIRKGLKIYDVEGIYLVSQNLNLKDLMDVSLQQLKLTVEEVSSGISKFLNLGSWFRLLPTELKIEAIHRAVNVERLHNLILKFKPRKFISKDDSIFVENGCKDSR